MRKTKPFNYLQHSNDDLNYLLKRKSFADQTVSHEKMSAISWLPGWLADCLSGPSPRSYSELSSWSRFSYYLFLIFFRTNLFNLINQHKLNMPQTFNSHSLNTQLPLSSPTCLCGGGGTKVRYFFLFFSFQNFFQFIGLSHIQPPWRQLHFD